MSSGRAGPGPEKSGPCRPLSYMSQDYLSKHFENRFQFDVNAITRFKKNSFIFFFAMVFCSEKFLRAFGDSKRMSETF